MKTLLLITMIASLIGCDHPTATTSAGDGQQWYCETTKSSSRLVYGEKCDGLACPMVDKDGDSAQVNPYRLSDHTDMCR